MRTPSDHIGRGLDSTVANWPLILMTMVERMVMSTIFVIGFLIAAIPPVVAGALTLSKLQSVDDPADFVQKLVLDHPFALIFSLLVIAIVLIPMIIIHSFFQAGQSASLLSADEKAGETGQRAAFRAFNFGLWINAAKANWWPVCVVINIVWSVAFLLAIVPVVAAVAVSVIAISNGGDTEGLRMGCFLFAISAVLMLVVSFFCGLWSQLSIFELFITRGISGWEACKRGWRQLTRRFGEALLTALLMMLIVAGAIFALILLQIALASASHAGLALIFLPIQLLATVAQSVIGGAMSCWAIATFASFRNSKEV